MNPPSSSPKKRRPQRDPPAANGDEPPHHQSTSETTSAHVPVTRARGKAAEQAVQRLTRRREQVRLREQAEPLRRRVLEALAEAPAISSVLAQTLGVARETVSRQLTALRKASLVQTRPVLGDARQREYFLTVEGEIELSQHRAFGAPESPPPDPSDLQTLRFLKSALDKAVKMRRKTNKLDDAATRLSSVVEQAKKANAQELIVEAVAELATTCRQGRDFDAVSDLLVTLDRIALGHEPNMGAAMALPAAAHREYALGRLPTQDRGLGIRADHLISAATLYRQLAEKPTCGTSTGWRARQAWSIVSLANNLRARSQFEAALWWSSNALALFEDLEDQYGKSRCLFMFGFCLRLLGDFDGAWVYLDGAHRLATENSFERFQADSLMQMGEVRRCQGEVEEAREMLDESLQRAEHMQFTVTQAFAQSARGAVECQRYRFPDAEKAFLKAHTLFILCDHPEGLALNARRRATAARRTLGDSGDRSKATHLVVDALERYTTLRSPAGMASCEIENGRLQIMQTGHARGVVQTLVGRLDDPWQRDLLEHDPWVPRVLCVFAEETREDDTGFTDRADRLLAAAQLRAQEARECAQQMVQSVGEVARQVTKHWHTESIIDEMGSETRCRHDSMEASHPICF